MTTDRFSMARTLRLTTITLTERRRELLLQSSLVVGVLLLDIIFTILGNSYHYKMPEQTDPALTELLWSYSWLFLIFGCLAASLMFTDLRNKQGRINALMRPANVAEKFLSRWLIYVVAYIVFFAAVVFIAESIRYIIVRCSFESPVVTPLYTAIADGSLFHTLRPRRFDPANLFAILALGYLAIQSFFVLGSAVWPRNSFIKTFAVGFLLTIIYFWSGLAVAENYMIYGQTTVGDTFIENHAVALTYIIIICAILINWTLACLRLGETDVITTKR